MTSIFRFGKDGRMFVYDVEVIPLADFDVATRGLRKALCELHRAISEYDATDADEARLEDAIAEAQRLAPYVPEPVSEEGF